jgi:hypothetical protein
MADGLESDALGVVRVETARRHVLAGGLLRPKVTFGIDDSLCPSPRGRAGVSSLAACYSWSDRGIAAPWRALPLVVRRAGDLRRDHLRCAAWRLPSSAWTASATSAQVRTTFAGRVPAQGTDEVTRVLIDEVAQPLHERVHGGR